MPGKHEWTRIVPEDNKTIAQTSRDISQLTTFQNLQAEIESLKLERDGYRVKYGKARSDIASLQAQLDEVNDQVSDLERALEHGRPREAGRVDPPRQDSLQVMHQASFTVEFRVHQKRIF
jgi:chromosome segregation ATPase